MTSEFLLAIDTTQKHCAACILEIGSKEIIASKTIIPEHGHAEQLFAVIGDVLSAADIGYSNLDRIVAATGPGNFTGIRVGLAAARALGMALNIPVIGISNLESCAKFAMTTEGLNPVLCVLDARNGNAYYQWFGEHIASEAAMASYSDIELEIENCLHKKIMICGSGAEKIDLRNITESEAKKITPSHFLSNAPIEIIARLGAEKPQPSERVSALYIRKPDAKIQAGFAIPREENSCQ